jgi:cation diffusion facilitator family transporter
VRREALANAALNLAVDTLMAVAKIVAGLVCGSHALLASALYSINDVLSSIAVTVSLRVGSRKANDRYPYGYGKAEFIASGMVSVAICVGVLCMLTFSIVDIAKGVQGPPHYVALAFSALSLGVSYHAARRSQRLADALSSPALATSADHYHADALGSLFAILGIGGALLSFPALDRIMAVAETVHLVGLSGALLARSTRGLMDAAIPDQDRILVERACAAVEGVERVVHVRSRRAGSDMWVDVAVAVGESESVIAARAVCTRVEAAVRGVLGAGAVTQVCFQSPRRRVPDPGPGGSGHG